MLNSDNQNEQVIKIFQFLPINNYNYTLYMIVPLIALSFINVRNSVSQILQILSMKSDQGNVCNNCYVSEPHIDELAVNF